MKKLTAVLLCLVLAIVQNRVYVYAGEPDGYSLYSISACLMDAETGRVLYEKNGYEKRANASTTKIMTCILALEYANMDDEVEISKYSAGMPQVKLGLNQGEKYRMRDLMYSLMLESHNDSAVAIAEHIAGDTEAFSVMMNEKAYELGCYDTYFITPNGLDATRETESGEKSHGTTAVDLARIMSYCIKNSEFLELTSTRTYSFTDISGSRSFSLDNKNAFLDMMEGVLSGKTGYTSQAGYCYTGAVRQGDKTLVVALLGCGWPDNKQYKWSDTKILMNYGLSDFEKKEIFSGEIRLPKIKVTGGANGVDEVGLYIEAQALEMLVSGEETVRVRYMVEAELAAPVKAGTKVGVVNVYIDEKIVKTYPVYTEGDVGKTDYKEHFFRALRCLAKALNTEK